MKTTMIIGLVAATFAFPAFAQDRTQEIRDQLEALAASQNENAERAQLILNRLNTQAADIDQLADKQQQAILESIAAAAGGGIQMRTPQLGQFSWSLGTTGDAAAAGIRYGITNNMSIYGRVFQAFDSDEQNYFVGIEGKF